MEVAVGAEPTRDRWREILPHRDDAFIHGFDVFAASSRSASARADCGACACSRCGRARTSSSRPTSPRTRRSLGQNAELDDRSRPLHLHVADDAADHLRLQRPHRRAHPAEARAGAGRFRPRELRDRVRLGARRATAQKVPVSIVYRKGVARDGTAPMLQYAYGAYGMSTDPTFSIARLSLLDRGFVYAIAHVRGGQELGRRWYDGGRLLNKRNTFTDFIDVTRHLVAEGYADPKRVFALGGSAGGLLMGAIANMAPRRLPRHRRRGAVRRRGHDDARHVDPADDERVRRMGRSVGEAVLRLHAVVLAVRQRLAAGLPGDARHDGPVGQPGAVLRARQVGRAAARAQDRRQPARCSAPTMEAGHGGKSGRFQRFREVAEQYAFIADQAGIAK